MTTTTSAYFTYDELCNKISEYYDMNPWDTRCSYVINQIQKENHGNMTDSIEFENYGAESIREFIDFVCSADYYK